jgi:hypothetical protein
MHIEYRLEKLLISYWVGDADMENGGSRDLEEVDSLVPSLHSNSKEKTWKEVGGNSLGMRMLWVWVIGSPPPLPPLFLGLFLSA